MEDFGTSGRIPSHPCLGGASINLPAEGVETSCKILIIRSLSHLQKLLSQYNEIFHPLFVHFCPLGVRLKMRSAG